MPRPKNQVPNILFHKATGQARCRVNGRDYYLGPWGSPEVAIRYADLLQDLAKNPQPPPKPRKKKVLHITLEQLYRRFRADIEAKSQRKTEANRVKRLALLDSGFRDAVAIYGDLPAYQFSPSKLNDVRLAMIERGWVRRHINRCVGQIKAAFRWAAGFAELVPGEVAQTIILFPDLKSEESPARESKPVGNANESVIEEVRRNVTSVVRAMIDLQLATGMRSGELVLIRPCDIDRSGVIQIPGGQRITLPGVWIYQPERHKTKHLKHTRTILIGPRGQAVLAPFLNRDPEKYCFDPAEAMSEQNAKRVQDATHHNSKPRSEWKRGMGRYEPASYNRAITYAQEKIDRRRRKAKGDLRKTVPRSERSFEFFHAHQLRHNAATRLAAEFGPEIARIILGHRTLQVTQVYVEDDLRKAARVMQEAG